MKNGPKIMVGIMDRQIQVDGCLNGMFRVEGFGPVSGRFSARSDSGQIVLTDEENRKVATSPTVRLTGLEDSTVDLFQVMIGTQFHWERKEDQTFRGDLIFSLRNDETITVINEIPLEIYLTSVISSEMNSAAPLEFLKVHSILSRSWLMATLSRKNSNQEKSGSPRPVCANQEEVIRWYDREDHDLFDVCADDHCQRYQGVRKIKSLEAENAMGDTRGRVITYGDEICDARYSKACGGLTENFDTAWEDKRVPYLTSTADGPFAHQAITTEEEATRWILSYPEAYCRTEDENLLAKILPSLDLETRNFFRWQTEYSGQELEEILKEKSGLDLGRLQEIVPLRRGPSGRIRLLKIVGSKRSVTVGKELEIRRWLSRTHLYSSAFVVKIVRHSNGAAERITFQGAGWGHGVGLCQIGAAVMAARGFSAEEILKHYFRGIEIKKMY